MSGMIPMCLLTLVLWMEMEGLWDVMVRLPAGSVRDLPPRSKIELVRGTHAIPWLLCECMSVHTHENHTQMHTANQHINGNGKSKPTFINFIFRICVM